MNISIYTFSLSVSLYKDYLKKYNKREIGPLRASRFARPLYCVSCVIKKGCISHEKKKYIYFVYN